MRSNAYRRTRAIWRFGPLEQRVPPSESRAAVPQAVSLQRSAAPAATQLSLAAPQNRMPPKPSTAGGAGDRRSGFLAAVKAQKLDTVRWSLTHGGQTPGTRDDDGFTAIHIAAASNKQKVLQLMLDLCRRSRELELIDLADGSVRGPRGGGGGGGSALLAHPSSSRARR